MSRASSVVYRMFLLLTVFSVRASSLYFCNCKLELQGIDTSALLTLDSYSDDEASLVSDDDEDDDPMSLGDALKRSMLGSSFTAKKIAQELLSKSRKVTPNRTMLTFESSKQHGQKGPNRSNSHETNKKHRTHPWPTMETPSLTPSSYGQKSVSLISTQSSCLDFY